MIEEIKKIRNKIVIVEGKKDKACLEGFGVENIITLSGIGLFEIVDKLPKCDEVVLLTDLDKKGKELYSRLRNILIKNGYKIDNRFRNYLFRETKIRQIEGLKKFYKLYHEGVVEYVDFLGSFFNEFVKRVNNTINL